MDEERDAGSRPTAASDFVRSAIAVGDLAGDHNDVKRECGANRDLYQ
jgi:hypothetical protein